MRATIKRFAVLISLLTIGKTAMAQCDNCPPPQVEIYGVQMNVSMPPPDSTTGDYSTPSSHQALSNWSSLENVTFALDLIAINDPEGSCVNWFFGTSFFPSDTSADSLMKVVLEKNSAGDVPPAGTLGGVDYLIWAMLDSSGGRYHFHVYLEDGYTRTRIDSAQGNFTTAADAAAAADSTVSHIEPVFGKIRAYQKSLVENGTNMALDPQISITPSQSEMNALQTIPVTFQVNDCDGTPLKSVTLTIGGSNGSFDQSSVVTDDNGEATANFTADNVSDVAGLTAIYDPYTTPMHQQRSSQGFAVVTINDPGLRIWQLIIIESENSRRTETGGSYFDLTFRSKGTFKQYILADITDSSFNTRAMYGGGGGISVFSSQKYITSTMNSLITSSGWISRHEKFTNDLQLLWYVLPSATVPTFGFISQIKYDGITTGYTTYYNSDGTTTTLGGDTPFTDAIDLYTNEFLTYPHSPYTTASFFGNDSGWAFVGDNLADSTETESSLVKTWYTSSHVSVSITPFKIPTAVKSAPGNVPKSYQLYPNYPNPFNPSTMISYDIPANNFVTLKIYDILGREVQTLVNQKQIAGKYGVRFDASRLASGIYFYRMVAGSYVSTRKMILIK
ncbi:MAG TPA: T9SS type A sorting domain-containing protein [Candidatus Kryptonia bacterium]